MPNKTILVLSIAKIGETSSRILKEAITLQKNSFDVTITGICFPGQKENEIIQGIPFKRYFLKTKKLPSNFFFQVFKLLELYLKLNKDKTTYDIIDCHCLYTLLIGSWLAKKQKAKLIHNAHELETEVFELTGFSKKIHSLLEQCLTPKCDCKIVVSKSIENWYRQEYPDVKISCIYNKPSYKEVENNDYFRKHFQVPADAIIFLYQGGLSKGRGVELLLETFSLLYKDNIDKYHVVFMGYGILEESIKQYEKKYSNIHFHGKVPQIELANYTSSADFGFSVIDGNCLNHQYCMPNKLFEYVMFDVPVIVNNTIDQANFVKENDIGFVLDDYSTDALCRTITNITIDQRDTFRANCRKIKHEVSWESQEDNLVSIYTEC